MASGTLSKFKSKITSKKLFQQDYYRLEFQNTPSAAGLNGKDFDLFIQASSLPGRSLSTLEVKKHNFTLRMPDRIEYDGSWSCTVLVDLNFENYKKLLKWQEYYSSFSYDMGGERGFPSASAKVVLLDNKFNDNTKGAGSMIIYGIYPTSVPSINLSQESSDYSQVDVTFAYSYTSDFGSGDISEPI